MDGDATVDKVCSIIQEAASNEADFIAFPETFVPIFPWWVYMGVNNVKQGELFRELYKNSFSIDSPQMKKNRSGLSGH